MEEKIYVIRYKAHPPGLWGFDYKPYTAPEELINLLKKEQVEITLLPKVLPMIFVKMTEDKKNQMRDLECIASIREIEEREDYCGCPCSPN